MKREKVLIVEDEMDLLDLLDFNLTRKGYVTAGALDGLDAMNKVDSFMPDVMVLDLMLPKVDGWEICRQIRQKKKDIRILMLSAKCMPEDKEKGFEAGADDYLTKPFSVKELAIRIDKLLENKRHDEIRRILLHEMSNRLTSIGCYSELLAKKEGDCAGQNSMYLTNMKKEIGYTSELIHEVSSLIELKPGEQYITGDAYIKIEKQNIMELIESVSSTFHASAADKQISIEIIAGQSVPEAWLNVTAIKQVLSNLIGNAVKYGRGGGNIEISIGSEEGLFIKIKDDGYGIPANELPHIFKRGYRGSNMSKQVKGSGLGLYIVKTIVDRMGGHIFVNSNENEGTEFLIYLGENGMNMPSRAV